jgi:hypothetical protein
MFFICICRVYGGLWVDFWGFGQGLGDLRLIRGRSRHDFAVSKLGLGGLWVDFWGFGQGLGDLRLIRGRSSGF